jgi:hypothetical protein
MIIFGIKWRKRYAFPYLKDGNVRPTPAAENTCFSPRISPSYIYPEPVLVKASFAV